MDMWSRVLLDLTCMTHFFQMMRKWQNPQHSVDFAISSSFEKNESYKSDLRGLLTTYPLWYCIGCFVWGLIILFIMFWRCMIWLDIDLFSWRFVLTIFLSLRVVMTWTLLHLPVTCLLNMASKNCCTVVGYFMPMFNIKKGVLFLSRKEWFHGLIFIEWEINYLFDDNIIVIRHQEVILLVSYHNTVIIKTCNISSIQIITSHGIIPSLIETVLLFLY